MGTMITILLTALAAVGGQIAFSTGPPELTESGGSVVPKTEQEYATVFAPMKNDPRFVVIKKKPAGLGPDALYGWNFVVNGTNRGWILEGDDERGWQIYLDRRGDGDLSDVRPDRFSRIDGAWRLQIEVTEGDIRWPCRFEVARIDIEGKQRLGVSIVYETVRRGVIEIAGKKAPFALWGSHGRYDGPYSSITIDRAGTGDEERYELSERYVNLFGKSYEFTVDPRGERLTLTELAEARPDRPSLKVGSLAPEFAQKDIEGVAQNLAKYRGRMLLLEFWSTHCTPCRADAPLMVAFYKETSREKLAFLGVSEDESEDALRAFLKEFSIPWPQIREPWEGAIHRLYRVRGMPTYYLLGPKGEILDTWAVGGEAVSRVKKFLAR
jgi:thiol-disulfide isomerase/thioredoxin